MKYKCILFSPWLLQSLVEKPWGLVSGASRGKRMYEAHVEARLLTSLLSSDPYGKPAPPS